MVKSVLGVSHAGLRDWVIQRITALILTIGFIGLFYFFYKHPQMTFYDWQHLFSSISIKVFTLLFMLSFAFHSWIGIWTVITDYVYPAGLRFVLHVIIFLSLLTMCIWTLLMLWGL